MSAETRRRGHARSPHAAVLATLASNGPVRRRDAEVPSVARRAQPGRAARAWEVPAHLGAIGALVLVDAAGRPLARTGMPAGLLVFEIAWAPVGIALAYSRPAVGATGDEVSILAPGWSAPGWAAPLTYPLATTASSRRGTLAWSPDGRWLAHPGRAGLTIAAVEGAVWSTPLDLIGTNPA